MEEGMVAKGLFRLWIVASGLWVAFWIFIYAYDRTGDFFSYLPLLATPPLTILGIGWLFLWAFRGFVSER